ncbi:RNA-directed DNA polymerase, eukaryota [Tanacetum coccineum]
MRGGVEQTQFDAVILAADTINLVPQYDRYKWTLSNDGEYSVASFRKKVDCCRSSSDATRTRWVNFIPIKVNIVAWKIKLNALPTRFNLSCRGIDIESLTCPTCEGGIETSSHLFFSCRLADQIYLKIARWWNVSYAGFSSYTNWFEWMMDIRLPSKLKELLEGVFYTTWWFLWGFRNKILFDSTYPSKAILFDNILSSSFMWCNSRCKASFTWNDWLKNPYLIAL